MNALNRLQLAFAEDLWGDGLQHLQGLITGGRLPAARLLRVYRNNFRISLREALEAVYPVIARLVGEEFFAFMTDRYLRAHPSRSGNLLCFGDRLGDFLSGFQSVADLPYLPDIARLEWACHEVFHAPDAALFDPAVLDQIAAEDLPGLHFEPGPACRLVNSVYPIFRIWQANQPDVPEPPDIDLSGGDRVLVVRVQQRVQLWALDPPAALFLNRIIRGNTLEQAVERVLKDTPDFDLQAVLPGYLAAGVVVPQIVS